MNLAEATQEVFQSLKMIYDESEASQITDWVMENISGLSRSGRLTAKEQLLSEADSCKLNIYIQQLLLHKPVQYVLGEAWFCGLKFYVDEHVLIPRPETEELVEWIISDCELRIANSFSILHSPFSILDIGSGSGCIPIALQKKLPAAEISSVDVCSEALHVAVENALTHEADIDFHLIDFLDEGKWNELGEYDVIVSNPPYITLAEKDSMRRNVVDHEPHLALFVHDDALIFYRKIAAFGKDHLRPAGNVYVEINEHLGTAVMDLFRDNGYLKVEIKKDMQGKDRMVKASFQ